MPLITCNGVQKLIASEIAKIIDGYSDLNGDENVKILIGCFVLNSTDGSLLRACKYTFHGGKTDMQSIAADINQNG